jgi:hypothetical protein
MYMSDLRHIHDPVLSFLIDGRYTFMFLFPADTAAVLYHVSQFHQVQLATAPVLSKWCASSLLPSAYNIR